MDVSRTRLHNISPLEDHTPDRSLHLAPKIGFRQEYQSLPSPYAEEMDRKNGQNRSHESSGFVKEWLWEVFTWLIGTAAFVAIIVLLVVFRNQPLDHWKLPKIQITTTVSALAQTAMATLIVSVSACIGQLKWRYFGRSRPLIDVQGFDDSSRGPAGSSLLLWNSLWRNRRPGFLVSLAAFTTILMTAFSTFAQQAVTIELQTRPLNSSVASLPRTTNYTRVSTGNFMFLKYATAETQLDQGSESDIGVDTNMLSAIRSGMLDSYRSLSNVSGTCSTSQCTWGNHTTLAVCSSVEDISSTTLTFNGSVSIQELKDRNRTLKDIVGRNAATFWTDSLFFPSANPARTNTSRETKPNSKGMPSLAEVYVVYWPSCNGTTALKSERTDPKSWRALKGTLNLCMLTLDANTTNGVMNTTVLDRQIDVFEPVSGYKDNAVNISYYCTPTGQEPRSCIDGSWWSSYARQLAQTFSGSAYFEPGGDNYVYSQSAMTLAQDVLGVDPVSCGNMSLTDHEGFKGFDMRLNNVATSMTNAMRTAPNNAKSNLAIGTTWESKQYIEADLRWLAFPAAVWLLSTWVLFFTLWKTKDGSVPIWKSSSLVLLQCMLADNGLGSSREVEKNGENSRVRLRKSGKSWQLVDTSTDIIGQ